MKHIEETGGDEVFLVIPVLPFAEAAEIARAILHQINKERLAQWPDVRLSASLGLTWTDDPAQNANDLLAKADRLMYLAKEQSRDVPISRLAVEGSRTIEVIE